MTGFKTKRMVETALLLALSVLLYFIRLPGMPYGGEVTLCYALPIIVISYRYGVRWGIFAGFTSSLLMILLHIGELRAYTAWMLFGALLFDYVLASVVLGLGGVFRNRFKNPSAALLLGSITAQVLRYVMHVISGYVFFWQFAEEMLGGGNFPFGTTILEAFSGQGMYFLYSIIYNAIYMIPEIILTGIAAFLVGLVPVLSQKPVEGAV